MRALWRVVMDGSSHLDFFNAQLYIDRAGCTTHITLDMVFTTVR
jgi:hypothetical protein